MFDDRLDALSFWVGFVVKWQQHGHAYDHKLSEKMLNGTMGGFCLKKASQKMWQRDSFKKLGRKHEGGDSDPPYLFGPSSSRVSVDAFSAPTKKKTSNPSKKKHAFLKENGQQVQEWDNIDLFPNPKERDVTT